MYYHIDIATNFILPTYLVTSKFGISQPKRNNKTNNLLVIRNRITGQRRYISCPLRLDVSLISTVANSIARCIQRSFQKLSGGRKS